MDRYHTRERPDDWENYCPAVYYGSSKSVYFQPRTDVFSGRQKTVSQGHRKSRDGKYHVGGDFYSCHIRPFIQTRQVEMKNVPHSWGPLFYRGPVYVPLISKQLGGHTLAPLDASYLDPIGAEAISIVDPTNPNAETGIALAEILSGGKKRIPIPGIQGWKQRAEVAKAAGSEFLNAQFGWLPLIQDIQDTVQSIRDGNTILNNYSDASGSNVHREFEFDPIVEESSTVVGSSHASYGYQVNEPALQGGLPSVPVTRERKKTTKRWFSGTFTYHADKNDSRLADVLGVNSEADKLFGLTLTPDVLWELAPWSWAIDWFSNTGNIVSNITAFGINGLVMRYGYIMEETTIVDTYTMPATGLTGVTGTMPPATYIYTCKRRKAANPFGFGLTWEGLSPTQLAITAALGITRWL